MSRIADEVSLIVQAQDWLLLRSYFVNKFSLAFRTSEPQPLSELAETALVWGRLFLPTYIRDESPPVHSEFLAKRFSSKNEYDAMPRGFAKAQSLDSRVLTPAGWVRMGDLQPGDFVMGADGKPKKILGFSPTTEMDLYRFSTRDGRSTLCNLDHLWEVTCPSNTGDKKVVKKTSEILKNYKSPRIDKRDGSTSTEFRYFIDTCKPLEFPAATLPLDPYTLGIWLGDGTSADGTVTSNDPEVFSYIPYEWKKTKADFRYQIYGIKPILRGLHLLQNKHIPEVYKFASVEQRLALLQGLIDSDGYVVSGGQNFEFSSARKRLFDDVVDLVRSLGGTATVGEQLTRFDEDSEYKLSYRFSARLPKGLCPVRLKRKSERWVGSLKTKAAISDISFEKKGLGRCMKVEDELYITDDYLVTHNTTLNQLVLCIVAAHKLRHFTVVLEKTFTEASEVLNVVRDEFSHNELLRIVYGDGVKRDTDGVFDDRNKDAQGDLFIFGVRFRGKGFNTPVRGLKSLEYRPDLILIDDVEEDTHIRSDEQRRKYRENYAQGIVPAVDVDGVIKVTGTILHQDSLLQNLIDQFGGTIYRAFDPTSPTPHLTLLWPARWTWERLMDKKAQMEMEGKGSSKFFQEYCNQPVDDLRRDFKQEHLNRLYTPADIKNLALFRTITIDPAESTKQGSDYTAVAVVDTDQNNNWYVRFIKRYRVNSAELIELMFELYKKWKPNVMGIERKAFADQIKPFLDIKAQETGEFFTVKELEHGGQRKEDRIRGALQGRFESGKIWFAEGAIDDTSILRGELYDFPFGKNDDLCFAAGTKIATSAGDIPIEKVKVGSFVFTPVGLKKVVGSVERVAVTKNYGWVRATPNHPIFLTSKGFCEIDTLAYQDYADTVCLTFNTLLQWTLQSLLSSWEKPSDSWEGKESIIFLNQQKMMGGNALKGCMLLFGSLLIKRKFRKAFMFTIRMATHLITTPRIWSVYQSRNILLYLKKSTKKRTTSTLKRLGAWLQLGTGLRLGSLGIQGMQSRLGRTGSRFLWFVQYVARIFLRGFQMLSFAQIPAGRKDDGYQEWMTKREYVSSVGMSLSSTGIQKNDSVIDRAPASLFTRSEKVYNIQVEDVNCYFANSILVGNCDALAYTQQLSKRPYGGSTNVDSSLIKEFFSFKKKGRSSSLAARL